MKTKPRQRKPSALSTARWTSYAITAGATAISGAPTAEAEIHYSGLIDFKFQNRQGEVRHSFPLSQGAVLVGIMTAAILLFELRANLWGRYRPMVVGCVVFLCNGAVLIGLWCLCVAVLLIAPALAHRP